MKTDFDILSKAAGNRQKVRSIWPKYVESQPWQGMSHDTLIKLCGESSYPSKIDKLFDCLPKPYWTTEVYGFGRCYRDWLNWPRILPIPVYGDHGVNLTPSLYPHETDNTAKYHLTWLKQRVAAGAKQTQKKIVEICHPWVTYRKSRGISVSPDASGTLIFLPHSTDLVEVDDFDYAEYINDLLALPEHFKPLIACVHMHDIAKGLHKKVKALGIPVVTFGNVSDSYFVDRFYDIAAKFEYATSNFGGSELFYCEDIGVKYFVRGKIPNYINMGDGNLPKGPMRKPGKDNDYLKLKKLELFAVFPPVPSEEKNLFVSGCLNSKENVSLSRNDLRKIFVHEATRMPHFVAYRILTFLIRIAFLPFTSMSIPISKRIF